MSETVERIIGIVKRTAPQSGDEHIDEATSLIDRRIGVDSVLTLNVLLAIEEEFDIEIDPADLIEAEALSSVGALAAAVEKMRVESEV